MNDERLSKHARGLVDAALAEEPSLHDDARKRMRGALLSSIAAGVGVTAATSAQAAGSAGAGASVAPGAVAGAAKGLTAGFLVKATAVVAIAAGLGAVVVTSTRTPAPPSPMVVAPVVQPPAPIASPTVTAETPPQPEAPVVAPPTPTMNVPARRATAQSASPPPEAPPAPSAKASDEFAKEVATLDRARAALASGDPTRALAELDANAPSPAFQEERHALRIIALCSAGRRDEGRSELARFRTSFPRSLQTERASRACE